jgi:hypothetical protein
MVASGGGLPNDSTPIDVRLADLWAATARPPELNVVHDFHMQRVNTGWSDPFSAEKAKKSVNILR